MCDAAVHELQKDMLLSQFAKTETTSDRWQYFVTHLKSSRQRQLPRVANS